MAEKIKLRQDTGKIDRTDLSRRMNVHYANVAEKGYLFYLFIFFKASSSSEAESWRATEDYRNRDKG